MKRKACNIRREGGVQDGREGKEEGLEKHPALPETSKRMKDKTVAK